MWNPFKAVNNAAKAVGNGVAKVAGKAVETAGKGVGEVVGVVAGKDAKNAVNHGAKVAGNCTEAGFKAANGIARIGLDSAECGLDAVSKGGNPGNMISNYTNGMMEKQSEKFCNVVATASGFNEEEIAKYVNAVIDPVSDKVADVLEKKFKKKMKKAIKEAVKKVLKKVLPKFLGKGLAKKVPVAGIAAGTAFAVEKAVYADWYGASMEFASGCVSVFPGPGTGASVALDIGILAHEISKEVGSELGE